VPPAVGAVCTSFLREAVGSAVAAADRERVRPADGRPGVAAAASRQWRLAPAAAARSMAVVGRGSDAQSNKRAGGVKKDVKRNGKRGTR